MVIGIGSAALELLATSNVICDKFAHRGLEAMWLIDAPLCWLCTSSKKLPLDRSGLDLLLPNSFSIRNVDLQINLS